METEMARLFRGITLTIIALTAYWCVAATSAAWAQERSNVAPVDYDINSILSQPVNVNVQNQTLYNAVLGIFRQVRPARFTIVNEITAFRTSAHFEQLPLRMALDRILHNTGYTYKVDNGILSVVAAYHDRPQLVQAGKEIPVRELSPGNYQTEWQYVSAFHPNGHLPGWVLKIGWDIGNGCGPIDPEPVTADRIRQPDPPRYCFIRICPQNGAMTPDWAIPSTVVENPIESKFYGVGVGPRRLPRAVCRNPGMDPREAWRRVLLALDRVHAEVPADFARPAQVVLRIVRDVTNGYRLRLVWQFAPENAAVRVSVDTFTGEVGDIDYSSGDYPKTDPENPLEALRNSPTDWIPTSHAVR
jgi:hypothetical protein